MLPQIPERPSRASSIPERPSRASSIPERPSRAVSTREGPSRAVSIREGASRAVSTREELRGLGRRCRSGIPESFAVGLDRARRASTAIVGWPRMERAAGTGFAQGREPSPAANAIRGCPARAGPAAERTAPCCRRSRSGLRERVRSRSGLRGRVRSRSGLRGRFRLGRSFAGIFDSGEVRGPGHPGLRSRRQGPAGSEARLELPLTPSGANQRSRAKPCALDQAWEWVGKRPIADAAARAWSSRRADEIWARGGRGRAGGLVFGGGSRAGPPRPALGLSQSERPHVAADPEGAFSGGDHLLPLSDSRSTAGLRARRSSSGSVIGTRH